MVMFGRGARMLVHEWIPDDQQKLVVKIRENVRREFVRISDLEGDDLQATCWED
jgi:hypothetical protein